MDYVDLQRRREDHARARRKPETPQRSIVRDPFLLVGTGFVVGSFINQLLFNVFYASGPSALLLFVSVVSLLCYTIWLLVQRRPGKTEPKLGSEKQLLLAILDAGGSMTPVEAALETSLTVDEAEEILTRFADRGHLAVQSRGGALYYTLPGRPAPETRTV